MPLGVVRSHLQDATFWNLEDAGCPNRGTGELIGRIDRQETDGKRLDWRAFRRGRKHCIHYTSNQGILQLLFYVCSLYFHFSRIMTGIFAALMDLRTFSAEPSVTWMVAIPTISSASAACCVIGTFFETAFVGLDAFDCTAAFLLRLGFCAPKWGQGIPQEPPP